MDHVLATDHADREQVALAEIGAIGSNSVDFIGRIRRTHVSTRAQVVPAQMDDNYVSLSGRPLALHPDKPIANIEDEVVPAVLRHGPEHRNAELDRGRCDPCLGNRSLVVPALRQHQQMFATLLRGDARSS